MRSSLSHIRNWIFDLDNTLYPASANLFVEVDARIGSYVARLLKVDVGEARRIQKGYFHGHGTTLAGLMAEHDVDPHHYLDDVHAVDMSVLEHNHSLAAALARLPGRKLIFTNADTPYAERVLDRLGLSESFEAIHDVHAMAFRPKPQAEAYRGLCEAYGIDPAESLFADDMARNLKPAHLIGMTTVWVDNGSEQPPNDSDRDFIDYTCPNIGHWLLDMLEEDA